jgi:hypothetical protein
MKIDGPSKLTNNSSITVSTPSLTNTQSFKHHNISPLSTKSKASNDSTSSYRSSSISSSSNRTSSFDYDLDVDFAEISRPEKVKIVSVHNHNIFDKSNDTIKQQLSNKSLNGGSGVGGGLGLEMSPHFGTSSLSTSSLPFATKFNSLISMDHGRILFLIFQSHP